MLICELAIRPWALMLWEEKIPHREEEWLTYTREG